MVSGLSVVMASVMFFRFLGLSTFSGLWVVSKAYVFGFKPSCSNIVVFSAFGSCWISTSYMVSPVWWILFLANPSFRRFFVQFSVGVNKSVEQ